MTNELAETNLTPQSETPLTKSETKPILASQNNCQGYQADPLTKLHLCQTCPYHQYRNETKP